MTPAGAIEKTVNAPDAGEDAGPAEVTVEVDGREAAEGATVLEGRFFLGSVPPGEVVLVVKRDGFSTARVPVQVKAGETAEVSVEMRKAPEGAMPPPGQPPAAPSGSPVPHSSSRLGDR